MPDYSNSRKVNESSALNRIIRGTVIIVVSLALAIVSVSFAVHHMRLQFEEEFKSISDRKITDISNVVGMTIHGDEIIADPVNATTKYTSVFNLMLANMSDDDFSDESYALFLYSGGQISPMILSKQRRISRNGYLLIMQFIRQMERIMRAYLYQFLIVLEGV